MGSSFSLKLLDASLNQAHDPVSNACGILKTAYEAISAYVKAAPQDAQTISTPTGTETGKEDLDQVRVNA